MPRFQIVKYSKLFGHSSSLVVPLVGSFSSTSTTATDALSLLLKDPSLTDWPENEPGASFPVYDPASVAKIRYDSSSIQSRNPKKLYYVNNHQLRSLTAEDRKHKRNNTHHKSRIAIICATLRVFRIEIY